MIEYVDQRITGRLGHDQAVELCDLRFVNCRFLSYSLAASKKVEHRTFLRNVELIGCTEQAGKCGPVFLCDSQITDLKTTGLFIAHGVRFQRVTIAGECGRIKLNAEAHLLSSDETNQLFAMDRDNFYKNMDWALDIAKARFHYAEFHGVPADLVRRDPETQIVIRREPFEKHPDWRRELDDDKCEMGVEFFLCSDCQSTVMVAPILASKKERERVLSCFDRLRKMGIADPD